MQEYLLADIEQLEDCRPVIVEVGGKSVGIIKLGDEFHVFENRCPHQGGPVCRGEVIPKVEQVLDAEQHVVEERFSSEIIHIVCPWHGWEFDIRTGRFAADPRFGLRKFETRVENGKLYARL